MKLAEIFGVERISFQAQNHLTKPNADCYCSFSPKIPAAFSASLPTRTVVCFPCCRVPCPSSPCVWALLCFIGSGVVYFRTHSSSFDVLPVVFYMLSNVFNWLRWWWFFFSVLFRSGVSCSAGTSSGIFRRYVSTNLTAQFIINPYSTPNPHFNPTVKPDCLVNPFDRVTLKPLLQSTWKLFSKSILFTTLAALHFLYLVTLNRISSSCKMAFNALARYLVVFSFLPDLWSFPAVRHVSVPLPLSSCFSYFSQPGTCPWFVQIFPYKHFSLPSSFITFRFELRQFEHVFWINPSSHSATKLYFSHAHFFSFVTGLRSTFLAILWQSLLQFLFIASSGRVTPIAVDDSVLSVGEIRKWVQNLFHDDGTVVQQKNITWDRDRPFKRFICQLWVPPPTTHGALVDVDIQIANCFYPEPEHPCLLPDTSESCSQVDFRAVQILNHRCSVMTNFSSVDKFQHAFEEAKVEFQTYFDLTWICSVERN